jgi:hypothetical protein
MENNATQAECCPEFNPLPWDNKYFEWDNKKFIKDKVCTFFYMPINFGNVMKKLSQKVEKASAEVPEWLCLSDHTSKWNMDIYLAVDKEVHDAENITLSGKYFSKVYEGDFKNTEKWMKDFKSYALQNKIKIQKWYMWYTTCPKCSKKYGKNYVVIIGKLD